MQALARKRKFIPPTLLIFVGILLLSGCRGGASNSGIVLLNQILNSRMTVLLKGTYASDRPLSFQEINNDQLFVDATAGENIELPNAPPYSKLPIYLDIGEIRVSTKQFMQDLVTVQAANEYTDFWNILSVKRQVYCSGLYATDFSKDTCYETGGLINFIEFMNGRGAVYPVRDVGPGTILHTGLFIRAMVTGYGRIDGIPAETRFDGFDLLNAYNILPLVNYNPETEAVEEQILFPQFFPLHHKVVWGQQTHMNIDHTFLPLAMEIRFNMKENLMLHGFQDATQQNQTIVAFSDWSKDHAAQPRLGGNVRLRSRIFYPDFVSKLNISGGTYTTRHYYALYVANECGDPAGGVGCNIEDNIPLSATPVRNGNDNFLENLPPGEYLLQCRWDGDAARDGYPETVLGQKVVRITSPNREFSADCPCGHSTTAGCN